MNRIPRSVVIAGMIMLAMLGYFAFGTLISGGGAPEQDTAGPAASVRDTKPSVIVEPITLSEHTVYRTFKGRTEANRTVTVRSETSGTVSDAKIHDGTPVRAGQVLCGLAVDSRAARVAEAEAAVDAARLDYNSAAQLQEKGWTTSNRAASLKAALDQAEAALASARIELERTRLRAPFAGVFERRAAEMGDFLAPGAACGDVVDLDPLLVVFEATEDTVARLQNGMKADITLASGQPLEGTVGYVARTANPATRTFRVEVEIENPGAALPAGLTAEARIAIGEAPAVRISPAALVLHDDGRVGVRYVDADSMVRFAEARVIDDAEDGVWITGLPPSGQLLREGQDYVREGTAVIAVPAEAS